MVSAWRRLGRLRSHLDWSSPRDGRWILIGVLLAYVLALAALHQARGRERTWETLGVPAGALPIIDAWFVTATLESHRAGYDVFVENPRDPWGRRMNYPRLWLLLQHTGLAVRHTTALAIGMAAAYLAAVVLFAGRLNPIEGIVVAAVVCSPRLMWVVERGNVDMLMFAMIAGALVLARWRARLRPLVYAAALLGGKLKLYPVAAIWCAARNRLRVALAWMAVVGGAFALYLALTWTDVQHILQVTPDWSWASYGRMVVFELVAEQLRIRAGVETPPALVAVGSLAGVLLGVAAAALIARRLPGHALSGERLGDEPPAGEPGQATADAWRMDGFLVGSGIFLGTFLVGTSFDYKLIFLILLLPQIFAWLRRRGSARLASWLLAAILVSCWTETLVTWVRLRSVQGPPASAALLQEVFNWLLFVLVAAVNMRLAHGWWRLGTKVTSTARAAHEDAGPLKTA